MPGRLVAERTSLAGGETDWRVKIGQSGLYRLKSGQGFTRSMWAS